MEFPLDTGFPPAPPHAVGVRRAFNRAVGGLVRVLPRYWRNRLGWWTWSDVMDPKGYYRETTDLLGPFSKQQPVATLLRRGFTPPSQGDHWPRCFEGLHNTWNFDNKWDRVSFHELRAWATIWAKHPKGQANLDMALAGVVGAGMVEHCNMLLDRGANPLASPAHGGSVMEKLWSCHLPWSKCLRLWKDLTHAHPELASPPSWQKWSRRNPHTLILSCDELNEWKESGLPLPSRAAAVRFASMLVDDVELGDHRPNMKANQKALAWWKKSGLLTPKANAELLKIWLSTARAGDEQYYQIAMTQWADLLMTHPLPPRPARGPEIRDALGHRKPQPSLPWSHWAMSGPFFENIPEHVRDALFAEPDAWTARNSLGETIDQVIERRIHDTRGQSRDEGLAQLRAWTRRHRLANLVQDRPVPSLAPGPFPARRM